MSLAERERECQAALLLRLRQLRRERAGAELAAARQAQRRALQAVQAAQAALETERAARAALLQALGTSPGLPRWALAAEARRVLLDDRIERADYALLDEQETLETADHALAQAAAALRRALARREAAERAWQQARREAAAARERRLEREDAAARPGGWNP